MIKVILIERAQETSLISPEILLTALLALLSALFIWLIKLSIDSFQKESVALNEVQIALALNAQKINDNKGFYDSWLSSMQEARLYAVQFHSLIFPYEKLKNIKSTALINQIIMTFYMCESFGKDLSGMHKSYYDTATSGVFKKSDDQNWLEFNTNTIKNVSKSKVSFTTISEKILEDMEDIKTYINLRKTSFRYKIISFTEGSIVSKFEKQIEKPEVSSEV